MRFGLCTSPDNLELTGKLGFDYIELAVAPTAALSDREFDSLRVRMDTSPIKAERFNGLFPGTIRLVGPEADRALIGSYLGKAFERVKALGGTVAVFGSGTSRAFPPGIPFKKTYRELVAIVQFMGDLAGSYGLTIAIEPLNRTETNCVNSLIEGAMLEAAVHSPSVGLLADLYHIIKEGESLDDIPAVKELVHTHVAILDSRSFPVTADEDLRAFFAALQRAAYSGTMSIEGRTENLESDAAAALATLRSL
ncbi:MAG: sugar phosphate isomerase/epimerase [Treponema sp.]|jgi:sugar phosphate isomerase/epimerase|nr:sugar phosphate isomerase/epimerase [Treponema sp.]